jgi:hypothetical protein
MDYLFIGDLHSQSKPLKEALSYAKSSGLMPVLLGDIWDSRILKDDTLGVMQAIWEYPDSLILLQSNHQWKLLRFLNGQIDMHPDICITYEKIAPYKKMVTQWLSSLPFGVIVTDNSGTVYKAAHAKFPSFYRGKDSLLLRSNTNRKMRELCMYGSKTSDGERDYWWERDNRVDRDWVRVAGHYHTIHVGDKSLVLDGSCGDYGGRLVAFDTAHKSLVEFYM